MRPHLEVADQTCRLTQSRYTDTGPTSPNSDPTTLDVRHGSSFSTTFQSKYPVPHSFTHTSGLNCKIHAAWSALIGQVLQEVSLSFTLCPQGKHLDKSFQSVISCPVNRLLGLVVKASATREEDPGFESRLCVGFFRVESYL